MSQYVVIDLEMCNILDADKRKELGYSKELIQIGAVLLNGRYEVIDTFDTFVKPVYGKIDRYIEELTGISRCDIVNAPNAENALKMFAKWIPKDAVIVSWSENDMIQIQAEMYIKNIVLPELEDHFCDWIDCQITFSEKMDNDRNYNLTEALKISAIDFEEGEHNALIDAKNTALLFAKMQKEPVFQISKYLVSDDDEEPFNNPFAQLLQSFVIA